MIKVVEVADAEAAWRIAQSANYQNPVGRMELELALYLRPQVVNSCGRKAREGRKGGPPGGSRGRIAFLHSNRSLLHPNASPCP